MSTTDTPTPAHLASTPQIDSDHPAVAAFARQHGTAPGADPTQRAVALYYAVRDGFRYDPYRVDFTADGMRASTVIALGYGWCVPKAALLAAACRAVGIPARVVLGVILGQRGDRLQSPGAHQRGHHHEHEGDGPWSGV